MRKNLYYSFILFLTLALTGCNNLGAAWNVGW